MEIKPAGRRNTILAVSILVFLFDRVSKSLVHHFLAIGRSSTFAGIDLTYFPNFGISCGLFWKAHSLIWIILAFSLAWLILLMRAWRTGNASKALGPLL